MLRNKSRAVASKQALMTDHFTQSSNNTKQVPSFFGFKTMPESEPVISPTSVLEPFSPQKNPFCSHFPQNKHCWDKLDSKGICVALIADDKKATTSKKMVLFSTNLRVQIPPPANNAAPKSPADFGIKTKTPQFSRSGFGNSAQVFTGSVSMRELELSEDYTCVISYGPNPKTTHIYHNCVLENCSLSDRSPNSSFLSFCHTCKKKLEQKNDIFIYRFFQ